MAGTQSYRMPSNVQLNSLLDSEQLNGVSKPMQSGIASYLGTLPLTFIFYRPVETFLLINDAHGEGCFGSRFQKGSLAKQMVDRRRIEKNQQFCLHYVLEYPIALYSIKSKAQWSKVILHFESFFPQTPLSEVFNLHQQLTMTESLNQIPSLCVILALFD
jgi:hypothetical protein